VGQSYPAANRTGYDLHSERRFGRRSGRREPSPWAVCVAGRIWWAHHRQDTDRIRRKHHPYRAVHGYRASANGATQPRLLSAASGRSARL